MADSRKTSHNFAITMNHVSWSKTCFGEFFVASCLVRRLAVGEEEYHPPLDFETGDVVDCGPQGVHHHAFIEFIDGYSLSSVRDMVEEFIGGEQLSIDIQVCRSPKSWLIYLSKEDFHPFLFNVRVCELSLYARAKHHAKVNYNARRSVRRDDPFIVSTGNNSRFVVGIIEEEIQRKRDHVIANRPLFGFNRRCNVSNEIIASTEHLYIEGPPGYGKTELVDAMLRQFKVWKAGEPSYFMFGTLNEDYDVIWFEDFDITKMGLMMSTLLSLMDGKPCTISRKHEDDKTILFAGRFIFTSNYPIGDNPHFRRRIKHVYVQHKLHECLGCVSDVVPVTDVDSRAILNDIEELISGDFNDLFTNSVGEEQGEGEGERELHALERTFLWD